MDRRRGTRLPTSYTVKICQATMGTQYYHAGNIGYGGLFIENFLPENCHNHFLALEISPSVKQPDAKPYPMKAFIIHRSEEGTGVIWADHHAAVRSAIDEIMAGELQRKSA